MEARENIGYLRKKEFFKMRTIRNFLIVGLASFLPIKNISAQDTVLIKGNPCLEWIADGIGNQNAKLEPLEENYLRDKFEKSEILYVYAGLDTFGLKMNIVHNSLKDALKYRQDNVAIWPYKSILGFNKKGEIKELYTILEKTVPRDPPRIDYKQKMLRREEIYKEGLK